MLTWLFHFVRLLTDLINKFRTDSYTRTLRLLTIGIATGKWKMSWKLNNFKVCSLEIMRGNRAGLTYNLRISRGMFNIDNMSVEIYRNFVKCLTWTYKLKSYFGTYFAEHFETLQSVECRFVFVSIKQKLSLYRTGEAMTGAEVEPWARKRDFPVSSKLNRCEPENLEKDVNPVIVDGQFSVGDVPNFTLHCYTSSQRKVNSKELKMANLKYNRNLVFEW